MPTTGSVQTQCEYIADHQRGDRKHRRRGVGQHVDIGRAKIVVVMMVIAMVAWS